MLPSSAVVRPCSTHSCGKGELRVCNCRKRVGKNILVRTTTAEICPTCKSETKVSVDHRKNLTGEGRPLNTTFLPIPLQLSGLLITHQAAVPPAGK